MKYKCNKILNFFRDTFQLSKAIKPRIGGIKTKESENWNFIFSFANRQVVATARARNASPELDN